MFKKTKIVATIGPATEERKILESLTLAGLDAVRLNFSHGDFAEHQKRLDSVRFVSKKIGKTIAVIQDLGGPKIRIGDFYKSSIVLKNGQSFILSTEKCAGDENKVFVNYKNLPKELKKGSKILLNDGKNELRVEKISGSDIYCRVIVGGEIKGRRGVNLPGTFLKISSLTEKDKQDIKFGIKNKVDFIAVSFVRQAVDVIELKNILKKANANIKVIAKIETQEAIEMIDEIIAAADGILVARGDLAVEISPEKVPMAQKMIIKKCNAKGKPVITATQMLESMIRNPVPTRAEVNDIANAILDGTDAVMLSEETALGDFPLKAVEVMSRVAFYTEEGFNYGGERVKDNFSLEAIGDSVSFAVVNVARNIGASAIFALTESGFTARMISRCKPRQPVIALTPNKQTCNWLALSFGCYPRLINGFKDIAEVSEAAKKMALADKIAKKGGKIVISAGIPFGKAGTTNLLLAETV
ncbi:MAG TPA: pyruvate kinase [Patescibacteria group bacterium]|nr:pyruvate kinase [Patescibacteria group bacterium]